MRQISDIFNTRGLRLAKLSNALQERYAAKDIFEDLLNSGGRFVKSDFMVDEEHTLAFGGDYYDTASGKQLNFMFSVQGGWEHLSVSMPSRTPTWDQMCTMKDVFWEDEEECIEYHPPKSQYVNVHEHCLHIWRPVYDEIFKSYMDLGFLKLKGEVSCKDIFLDAMGDSTLQDFEDLLSAESGKEVDLTNETVTVMDNVPIDLLYLLTPPYFRVGTKTSKGKEVLDRIAKKNGIKVGLTSGGTNE
jgi:hypothetical protein